MQKLATITIEVYGLPESCGTDDELQELTDDAEALLECLVSYPTLSNVLAERFPGLADKIQIKTPG